MFFLGQASAFELVTSKDPNAVLVDVRLGDQRRILMLSIPGEQPLVEDLTGQLALAAGRGPMSGIDGVELDLGRFAQTGVVGLRAPPVEGRVANGQQYRRQYGRRY